MSVQGVDEVRRLRPLVAIQFVIEVHSNPDLLRVPDGPAADRNLARELFPFKAV